MIQCLCKGLRNTLGKDGATTGAGLRNLDLKYLGKGMKFYGLIIIGRNFGVIFVHKQRSSMNPWQWSKDTLGRPFVLWCAFHWLSNLNMIEQVYFMFILLLNMLLWPTQCEALINSGLEVISLLPHCPGHSALPQTTCTENRERKGTQVKTLEGSQLLGRQLTNAHWNQWIARVC